MDDGAGTPRSSPVTRRVVTQRRRRPLRVGIALVAAGIATTVLGGILLTGSQAAQVLAPADRAEVPDPLRFDAEARRYSVVLLPDAVGIPFLADPVAQMTCTVTLSDDTEIELRGSRQGVRTDTSAGTSIGDFEAVAGPTRIDCGFTGDPETSRYYVAVAPQRRALERGAVIALATGIGAALVGVGLVIIGLRGRAVVVPTDP